MAGQSADQENIKILLEDSLNTPKDPREVSIEVSIPEIVVDATAPRASKKRQCANCTCSRSKGKSKKKVETDEIKNEVTDVKPKSGCGSCSKGDAFRCEGCPYKGMPAFKEGEEFKFDEILNDL